MQAHTRSMLVKTLILIAALVGVSAVWRVASQPHSTEYNLSSLRWRNVGPMRGGRSLAVAGSTKRPNEYFFGATGGGVWKTQDGGTSWRVVTDGQLKSSSVGAIAVSESNPDVVYVGMGETELRGSVMQGDGVYKTADGGKTWSHIGLEDTLAISRIRIDPTNPDLVFVAALGHPYGKNEERGVFRSDDGGKSWKKVLYRDDQSGAIDLSMDAHNPKVLFASIWEVYRRPWTLWSGGPGCGLFKTEDGGDHWTEITHNPGLPQGLIGKINVSVSGADSNRVYANVESDQGGLFRSDDAGATWKLVNVDRNIRQRAFYFNRIQADTKDRDTLYMMNVEIFKSTDGGKSLIRMRTAHSDHHDFWIASDNPRRLAAADDGGGNISVDGGQTWTRQHFATAQLYHVIANKDVPYTICGNQQDAGPICVPSSGGAGPDAPHGDGDSGDPTYTIGGGEDGYIAFDPLNSNVTYSGDQAGIIIRYNRETHETRDVQVNPWFFSGMGAKDLKERWQWVFPLIYSPIDPHTLYTSSQHLFKTTNGGQSWERISPDLTRADPDTMGDSGGPINKDQNGPEIYATIYAVAPSHFDIKTIWAGSDDGLVHVTRDGGAHWNDITPTDLPKFSRVSYIDASPNKAGSAYLAANRYEMDDRKPYVYRTEDYGKNWTKIVDGIPDWDFPRTIREDPKRAGLLFLGTEHTAYVSFNNGGHWQRLSANLPDTQVTDAIVVGNDLVISTYGRSFNILDNLGVLRQLNDQVVQSDAHLFKPEAATRSLHSAIIDYFLKQPANDLRITILDPAGKTVREFAASARGNARGGNEDLPDLPSVAAPAGRGGDNVENKAGLNRFTWDLRYPGAVSFPNMILRGGSADHGPVAVPGEYKVQLTANGKTQTQTLTILKDARLKNVTDADLRAQFKLATEARDKTSECNEMVIQIRQIKKQIDDRVGKTQDQDLASAGKALAAKLSAVEETLYQVKNRSPRDTLNYPIKLNNQLAVLTSNIETGDVQPTNQMYTVLKDLSRDLAHQKEKLDGVLKTDLPKFNEQLKSKQLDPVAAK